MHFFISKLIGIAGLLLITLGVLSKTRKLQNHVYISGGSLLIVYSILVGDIIFTILQIVFVLAAAYDLLGKKK